VGQGSSFKSILITGASSGLGGALARAYAKPGVTLGLIGRSQEKLDKVAETCRAAGAEVRAAAIDVWAPGSRTSQAPLRSISLSPMRAPRPGRLQGPPPKG
jgi:short-subunit dehydrogenase